MNKNSIEKMKFIRTGILGEKPSAMDERRPKDENRDLEIKER